MRLFEDAVDLLRAGIEVGRGIDRSVAENSPDRLILARTFVQEPLCAKMPKQMRMDLTADRAPDGFQFVRRARGYTPRAIKLPQPGPSVVALGGYFKNTVCLTRGDEAFVSQHIGDLDNAPTCAA